MLVWTLVIAVTVIACAALFYAGRTSAVNAAVERPDDAERIHQQNVLEEIDRAEAEGQLSPEDAVAARAELARDVLRRKQAARKKSKAGGFSPAVAGLAVLAVAVTGVGTYAVLGNPDMPAMPLASRNIAPVMPDEVASAVAKVEAQLQQNPDDVRGWQVLGPVYMRAGRYDDAVMAYRRVLDLSGMTPDSATDLAEALSLANNGMPDSEAIRLLEDAAAADPEHLRSRFYLAGDALRRNEFARARDLWSEVIDLSDGTESWREAADEALAMSEAGLATEGEPEARSEMIAGMVEGLASRLDADGGTIDEWTQLVRAFLVLNERDRAQKAYDDARAAYPDAADRGNLDALAQQNGLE